MVVVVVVAVVALAGLAVAWFVVARGSREGDTAANRQVLQAQLSVLADDVVNLEPAVDAHPEARPDYDAAVSRYRAAQAAADYARDDAAYRTVTQLVSEASYSMSRARAIVEGRPPPEPSAAPAPPPAAPAEDPVVVLRPGRPFGRLRPFPPVRARRMARRLRRRGW